MTFNLRFPGQYYDSYSKLFYNHNRYYNPELGRYMEPDPTGLDAGLNPYVYAGNNPVGNVDPTGLAVNISLDTLGLYLPSIPEPAYNFSMGLANGISFGLAQPISDAIYGSQTANVNSNWYSAGEVSSMLVGAGNAAKGATQAAIRNADNVINSTRVILPDLPKVTWKTLGKEEQNAVNGFMTQYGKGAEGAQTLLTNLNRNGVPANLDLVPFKAYQNQILSVGGNKMLTKEADVFKTRLLILNKILKDEK